MIDVIPLPVRLDAATAPRLASDLSARDMSAGLCLDARQTQHIGAMGAQVLLSARTTVEAHGATLTLTHLGDRAHQQLCLMGLEDLATPKEMT